MRDRLLLKNCPNMMISLDFGPVTTSPLRKCCESSDLGGLVLVQETQLGSLPLHCPYSRPHPDHFLPAEDALLRHIQSTGSPAQPFSHLNCTRIKFHPSVLFPTVDLFLTFVCHACQMTRKRVGKEWSAPDACVAELLFLARRGWVGTPVLAHPASKHRYRSLQNCSPLFASQQPRRHLALTQMPAHTLTPRVSGGRTQPAYLQPFSPHPAHRAVTLRWPSHHLKLV